MYEVNLPLNKPNRWVMNIGQNIFRMRKLLGLSRRQVADDLGLSSTLIENLENERTESIQKINKLYSYLMEQSIKYGINMDMQEIKVRQDYLPGVMPSLEAIGYDFNKTNKILAIHTANTYYQIFLNAVQAYVREYDEQYQLVTALNNRGEDVRTISHYIAIDFVNRMLKMFDIYISRIAAKENIDIQNVQINNIVLMEWSEILCNDLHDYMSKRFSYLRPVGELSHEYIEKLCEYMSDAE